MAEKPSPANVRVGPTGWSVRVVISLLTRRGRRARLSGRSQIDKFGQVPANSSFSACWGQKPHPRPGLLREPLP